MTLFIKNSLGWKGLSWTNTHGYLAPVVDKEKSLRTLTTDVNVKIFFSSSPMLQQNNLEYSNVKCLNVMLI
jgi:hypothetical protein